MRTAPRRAFAALLVANGISIVGNELIALAIPWLVLTQLGTPADIGLVGAGLILPAAIGAIGGGVIVDRLGQRRTSILGDLLSAATVAAIPLLLATGLLSIPILIVLAFLGALLDAPGTTARQVLVPTLGDAAGMTRERANGLYQTVENAAFLTGPLLAGVIVVTLGTSEAFWIDAASFVVCAALVWLFVPGPVGPIEPSETGDVLAGLRSLRSDGTLRALAGVAVIANFAGTPLFVVLLPLLTLDAGMDANALGLMVAAYAGGLLLGSLWFAARRGTLDRRRLAALSLGGTGAGLAVAATTGTLALTLVGLAVAGFASGPFNPLAFTLMQERIPEARRGRTFGAILGGVLLAAPVGMLAFGVLTEQVRAAGGLWAAAMIFIALSVLILLAPSFRRLDEAAGDAV